MAGVESEEPHRSWEETFPRSHHCTVLTFCMPETIVTNTFITLSAESKISNEAGVLYSLMRKVVNFSTFSVFKVFLEYEVNLSQYNGALNVCSWVNEVIRLLGKLGGLNKGLELMNQKKRC